MAELKRDVILNLIGVKARILTLIENPQHGTVLSGSDVRLLQEAMEILDEQTDVLRVRPIGLGQSSQN